MIGVIAAGLKYFGVAQTLNGAAEEAEASGYSIILKELASFDVPDIVPVVEFFLAHRVEGIIFAPPQMGANIRHVMDQLPVNGPPVVFLKAEPTDEFTTIGIDNEGAARLATEHLLALGRTRIAHIAGPLEWREARDRRDGWLAALAGAGIEPGPMTVASWSSEGGAEAACPAARRGPGDRCPVLRQRPDRAGRAPRRERPGHPDPRAARGGGLRRPPRDPAVHARR